MDSAAQAAGEARVRDLLIEPLEIRGLAKPPGLTRGAFEDMKRGLCAKLAYMTDLNLSALAEHAAASPGGKDRDRFPIANLILTWAAQIQPPGDDASPLIRAVFAADLGRDAIAGGWAPELLTELRRHRRWPQAFAVTEIKARADDAMRQMVRLDEALARGHDLTPREVEWQAARKAAIEKCQRIADLTNQGAST